MLRTIFGKKDESENPAAMASTITAKEFKDAVDRYPALLKGLSKPAKEGHLTLEELDSFRYNGAPMAYSKKTGRIMESKDVQKLVEWKMRHGIFRPSLPKQVASNSDEKIAAATKDAFQHYGEKPEDISGVLKKLSEPLKGVGPATASLLLAVHDPSNVVFFSDELYRWLCADGEKVSIKYTPQEFEDLFGKAKSFMSRIKCTPIELEKAAFVIIRESDPVPAPTPKKEPSGRARGRPKKPESEKKAKKEPSGLPRGRPKKPESEKKIKMPTAPGASRGRPPKATDDSAPAAAAGEPKKRGRPKKAKVEEAEEGGDEVNEEEAEETTTPKKRKATDPPASSAKRGKKAKA